MNKQLYVFTGFSYLWSYVFWGLAIYFSQTQKISIVQADQLITNFLGGNMAISSSNVFSFLAGFGPAISAILTLFFYKGNFFLNYFKFRVNFKYLLELLLILFTVIVLPSLVAYITIPSFSINASLSFSYLFVFLISLFIYQLFTTATEELGWRGILLVGLLKNNYTLWRASFIIGLFWAFWHLPILIYVYLDQGLSSAQIPMSLIGFIAGTIGMSLLHTYFFMKTRNIFFSMIVHALFNTVPIFMGLIFSEFFMVSIITQIGIWLMVYFIEKRQGKIFNQKYSLQLKQS